MFPLMKALFEDDELVLVIQSERPLGTVASSFQVEDTTAVDFAFRWRRNLRTVAGLNKNDGERAALAIRGASNAHLVNIENIEALTGTLPSNLAKFGKPI